jgi:small conductance mechanosensitive channel
MADDHAPTDKLKTVGHSPSRRLAIRGRQGLVQIAVLVPLLVLVLVGQAFRTTLFGLDQPIKIVAAVAVAALGLALARALGQAISPAMMDRLGPATAGSVDFLIRIVAILIVILVALRVAGVRPEALAAGAGVATLVLGFASQQTLSQVVAGAVILTTKRFQVGDRIRVLSPQIEGKVKIVGLLYTEIELAKDLVSVPNSSLLSASIVPVKSASTVEMRARLPHTTQPSQAQQTIESAITTPTATKPSVTVEEVHDEDFTVSVSATPLERHNHQKLVDEMTGALADFRTNGNSPKTPVNH